MAGWPQAAQLRFPHFHFLPASCGHFKFMTHVIAYDWINKSCHLEKKKRPQSHSPYWASTKRWAGILRCSRSCCKNSLSPAEHSEPPRAALLSHTQTPLHLPRWRPSSHHTEIEWWQKQRQNDICYLTMCQSCLSISLTTQVTNSSEHNPEAYRI